MRVEEWLESVKKLDELIAGTQAEREQILAMATRMGGEMDGMPHAKGNISDPTGNGGVKLAMLAKDLDRQIDEYKARKQEVVDALKRLPAREYGVLHRIYIRYMTREQIAEDIGKSTTQVWRIKNHGIVLLWGMGYPKEKGQS